MFQQQEYEVVHAFLLSNQPPRENICLSSDGRRPLTDSNRFGSHYPELTQKHTQGSVHTQPNERTARGCKNDQHRKLSYNLAVLAKPYFCSKWSQYTSRNTPVAYNVMGVRSSGEEMSSKMNSATLPLRLLTQVHRYGERQPAQKTETHLQKNLHGYNRASIISITLLSN